MIENYHRNDTVGVKFCWTTCKIPTKGYVNRLFRFWQWVLSLLTTRIENAQLDYLTYSPWSSSASARRWGWRGWRRCRRGRVSSVPRRPRRRRARWRRCSGKSRPGGIRTSARSQWVRILKSDKWKNIRTLFHRSLTLKCLITLLLTFNSMKENSDCISPLFVASTTIFFKSSM